MEVAICYPEVDLDNVPLVKLIYCLEFGQWGTEKVREMCVFFYILLICLERKCEKGNLISVVVENLFTNHFPIKN